MMAFLLPGHNNRLLFPNVPSNKKKKKKIEDAWEG
jgi:hypothetical protein